MNNKGFLDINLKQISQYNPDLKYKLLRCEMQNANNNISMVKTILNEDNLIYNKTYIHNNYGAEAEAKEIVENIENNYSSIIIIYGIGYGYLFKETVKKAKGTVLLYEPDINILYKTLKNNDFSQLLSQKNVFIFSDYKLLKKEYIKNFCYKSNTKIIFLPSYNDLFKQEINNFTKDINLTMHACIATNNFIKNNMFSSIKSVCNNIDLLVNELIPTCFQNKYNGQTAIIITDLKSDKNIEKIYKYKDNTVIFADAQSLRTLIDNNIIPDFAGISATENNLSQFEDINISDINAIIEPLSDRSIHQLNFKNIFSYPSHNRLPNIIWTTLSNINATPYCSYEKITYTLLKMAQILGFKDIIVINDNISSEISYLEDFKQNHQEINLYNTSINDTKTEELFKELVKHKLIVDKNYIKQQSNIDIKNIVKNISQEIINLEEIIKFLKSGSSLIANLDKELHNKKNNLDETCLNYFKQLLMIYVDLKEIYAPKNRIFLYLQQSYSLDLEYELKENNQTNSIPKVYDLLKIYINSLISNITEIKEILNIKAGKLNEMLNTKG